MKTLIVQSYRRHDVAPWIADCMNSVRCWAEARGHAYEFIDDRFFDYAPVWVRNVCASQTLPVTDVARLYLMRDRLAQGFERAAWIDADVLVFAPENFSVDDVADYSLCREVWLRADPDRGVETIEKVNNAVTVMCRNAPLLDFWIFAAEEILRAHPPHEIGPLIVGTNFLTGLAGSMPLRVLQNVGLFSPAVVRDMAHGNGEIVRVWARAFGRVTAAVNLCASLQDRTTHGVRVDADDMQRVVDKLLRTRGAVVNDHLLPAARWG